MQMSKDVFRETFEAGTLIFREGDQQAFFFFIDDGQVEIFTTQGEREIRLAKLGPGESFGEFALLDNAPRSASARALTKVRAYKISEKGFEHLLKDIPEWASFMLKSFVRRLKAMNAALKAVRSLP